MYRQGDVLLIPCEKIPQKNSKKVCSVDERVILKQGEYVGHAHSVSSKVAELFEMIDIEDKYMKVKEDCTLDHQTHSPIVVPKGKYIVRNQEAFSIFSIVGHTNSTSEQSKPQTAPVKD